jgi:hypothetical protein
VQIQGKENAKFLTFKLDLGKKPPKNYNSSLALFLAMLPQHLSGNEFQHLDSESNSFLPSPTAELHTIVAYYKDKFVSLVKIEGNWVYFCDEEIVV